MEDRRTRPRRTDLSIRVHQCVLTRLGRETWLSAQATDCSDLGICLILGEALESGERLYLLATLSGPGQEPEELSTQGVTTYCRLEADGRWRVGVQFIDGA